MGIDLTPRCVKCGCELDVTSMRALPEGKGFVCKNCYEHGNTPSSPFTVNKDRLRPLPSQSTNSVSKEESPRDFIGKGDDIFNQKEYVCNTCGYQFKKSSDFVVKVCPYCGKRDVAQKVETSSDFLLD